MYERAQVHGDASVGGDTELKGDADVSDPLHSISFVVNTSDYLATTLFRDSQKGHQIIMGCWSGTVDDLSQLIEQDDWIETKGPDATDARPEMRTICQLFRDRIDRWDK